MRLPLAMMMQGRRMARVTVPNSGGNAIGAVLDNVSFFGQQSGTCVRTLTLTRTSGYTGDVALSATGLPSGTTIAFSPATLSGATLTATVTLTHSAGASLVTSSAFTITASAAGVTSAIISANVTVVAPGSIVLGPGPNAPAWSGKTAYPEELFLTPIPVHYAAPNAAGFKGFQGFEGAWGGSYNPVRVTYPTVSTPLGVKPVMQVLFPGSSGTVNAINGATANWSTKHDYAVRITGTWSGTFVFERSLDGGTTWNPVTLRGTLCGDGVPVPPSGSTANVNGVWASDTDYVNQLSDVGLFRVRATSWSSGTATIAVGMRGGEAAARGNAGDFGGTNPTRVYTRLMITTSPDWSDGGNTGTKGFFYTQEDSRNHYTGLFTQSGLGAFSGLQFFGSSSGVNRNMDGGTAVPRGSWADFEWLFIANTPGAPNGILRSWVNGTQYLNLSDVNYIQAEAVILGFQGLWLDPTYGGGEAPPDNNNNYFRIAGWYRESAP